MKGDDSWVVIGVLMILMVDSGQSYHYKCKDDIYYSITGATSYLEPRYMPNLVKDMHDDIVATTSNYFDTLTAEIEDPKTFVCASMYKKPEDKRNKKVIFNVKYRKDDKIVDYTMQPELTEANRGSFFKNCDECPDIVDSSYGYRFYSGGGVYGVYTCSWSSSRSDKKPEGFIKASFSLTRNADGTGKKELSPETKALIEEARAKAQELGIDISENVPFGCNTEPPRADLPPTKASPTQVSPTEVSNTEVSPTEVSHTERSPTNVSPASTALIHKYGIAVIILVVGGFAVLYGTR